MLARSCLWSVRPALNLKFSRSAKRQNWLKAGLIASVLLVASILCRGLLSFSGRRKLSVPLFLRGHGDDMSVNLLSQHDPAWRSWLKQSKIHVSAIVFYGRRDYVRILDAYIKQNLVSAGGLLEEASSGETSKSALSCVVCQHHLLM